MGMFDELTFSEGFNLLPEKFDREGWQTKDLDKALDHYLVQEDGLLVRKRTDLNKREPVFEINPSLCIMVEIYKAKQTLLLVIGQRYVREVQQDWQEEPPIKEVTSVSPSLQTRLASFLMITMKTPVISTGIYSFRFRDCYL